MSDRRPLRSGTLARLAGVSADTLRFYERRGLLPRPPRGSNNYRRYPPTALDRVRVIQRALDAGFTIAELARVFRERDAGGAPCRSVFGMAQAKLAELDARIKALVALRKSLRQVVGEWERRLEATPAGARAGLLDGLATTPAAGSRTLRRPAPTRRRT